MRMRQIQMLACTMIQRLLRTTRNEHTFQRDNVSERQQLALFRHKVSSTKHGHRKPDSLMGLLSLTMKYRVYFWQSNKRCALLTTNMTQQYGRHLVYSPVCLSYVILYQPRRIGTGFTCIMQRTLVMSFNNPDSSSDLN